MLKAAHRFNFTFAMVLFLAVMAIPASSAAAAETAPVEFKKSETGLWQDFFDQNIYYDLTHYLRLDHLYWGIAGKKPRAKSINVYDEVPDNTFYTNRHARKPLTQDELIRGYRENDGPDASGDLTIFKGRFGEFNSRIFVKDSRGGAYLLKFDPASNPELGTGAEIIASRFFHAFGYNVPQNTLLVIDPSQLKIRENTKVYDSTGFEKTLTQENLERYLISIAQNEDGKYRVVASKVISGELKGPFSFNGRRKNDPNDPFDHHTRREIRGLKVFAAWLNYTDIRANNSMDSLVEINGQKVLKHYLVDMDAALGSESRGSKPANFGHEYFVDYGQSAKALLGLGFWEKPWQKRWREKDELNEKPAAGYFDNRYFRPKSFKPQLPSFAFKEISLADGFWAAKQVMAFTDEQIAAVVKTGEYSDPEVAKELTHVLIERRDLIGKYWFTVANPLDAFDIQNGKLVFSDLGVKHGFYKTEETAYHIEILKPGKNKTLRKFTSAEPALALDSSDGADKDFKICVTRSSLSVKPGPWVLVQIRSGKIALIHHQD